MGKSQQRIKVLVQGENTTSLGQMVGKAISESMHQEDATGDPISRSPGQHDLLLRCVRSPQLPYRQGLEQLLIPNLCAVPSAAIPARTRTAPDPKSVANTGVPYSELHPVKCNKLA